MRISRAWIPIVALLAGLLAAPALGQSREEFQAGQTVERVVTEADPAQAYAVYLPPEYKLDAQFPVLVLMDPRGRAMEALQIFRPGAERFGYIVVSSYGTRSDATEGDPTGDALRAILPDLGPRFAIDNKRLYLAGFSGTARLTWMYSESLKDNLAGLVGFGASTQKGFEGPYLVPFFGGAGTTDFNYDEVWSLDATLDGAGIPHRIRYYAGGHSWPPPEVASEALAWMEIQAMKDGKRKKDDALVRTLHEEGMARAESTGDPWQKARLYGEIATDFEGLVDVSAAAAQAAKLESSDEVKHETARREEIHDRQMKYVEKHQIYLGKFLAENPIPLLNWSLNELDIRALQRKAKNQADPLDADAAERSLNLVYVYASFYQPQEYLKRADAPRAVAALQLAEALQPDDPGTCLWLARAYSSMGKKKPALTSLTCAADAGLLTKDDVAGDEYLDNLRDDPGFQAIVAGLSG